MLPNNTEHVSPQAYPLLRAMRLTQDEFDALRRQGFVSYEKQGARVVAKLRFRMARQQRVRCVDVSRAAEIQAELDELQRAARVNQRLAKLRVETRQALRRHRELVRTVHEARGFHFHGYALRRRRGALPLTAVSTEGE
jgi:hypothetical protein